MQEVIAAILLCLTTHREITYTKNGREHIQVHVDKTRRTVDDRLVPQASLVIELN